MSQIYYRIGMSPRLTSKTTKTYLKLLSSRVMMLRQIQHLFHPFSLPASPCIHFHQHKRKYQQCCQRRLNQHQHPIQLLKYVSHGSSNNSACTSKPSLKAFPLFGGQRHVSPASTRIETQAMK
jgi:hypothetical protein